MIDLLVAGGGPAGLAAATHAARAGLDVVVLERRRGPIDKACGEGLMPHTVAHLRALGAEVHGESFVGITYTDGRRSARAQFPGGAGMGVRRTVLHSALTEAAETAGVRIVQAVAGPVSQDRNTVYCSEFRSRYLAAADGLHSPIRRSLGFDRTFRGRRRWGIRRHYRVAPWSDTVEVHWGPGAEAYVTPVGEDCVGVAVLTSEQGRFDEQLARFPVLGARLAGAPHGSDRAAGPLRQRVADRAFGRVLLVGDAAGYVDALTGEGLGTAFGGAESLVECVLADAPQDYDRKWRAMSRRYRVLTAGLLYASGIAPVRSLIVPAAATLPRAFAGIVNQLAH